MNKLVKAGYGVFYWATVGSIVLSALSILAVRVYLRA